MQRLLVDMDGVLADIYRQMFDWDARETGRRRSETAAVGRPEHAVFPYLAAHLQAPGFFRGAPVMPGSREALEKLNRAYEVFVVSAATEFPQSLAEKQAWLGEHLPFLTWRQFVFCGSKRVVHGDVMIDDHFKNLDGFPGRTLLFTQPHNELADPGRHERVGCWADILGRLQGGDDQAFFSSSA